MQIIYKLLTYNVFFWYIYSVNYKPKNNYFNLKIVYDIQLKASHTARKARFCASQTYQMTNIISKNIKKVKFS